jgi:hypothetical protein
MYEPIVIAIWFDPDVNRASLVLTPPADELGTPPFQLLALSQSLLVVFPVHVLSAKAGFVLKATTNRARQNRRSEGIRREVEVKATTGARWLFMRMQLLGLIATLVNDNLTNFSWGE